MSIRHSHFTPTLHSTCCMDIYLLTCDKLKTSRLNITHPCLLTCMRGRNMTHGVKVVSRVKVSSCTSGTFYGVGICLEAPFFIYQVLASTDMIFFRKTQVTNAFARLVRLGLVYNVPGQLVRVCCYLSGTIPSLIILYGFFSFCV